MDAKARRFRIVENRLRPPKPGHEDVTDEGVTGAKRELGEKATKTKIDVFLEGIGLKRPKA